MKLLATVSRRTRPILLGAAILLPACAAQQRPSESLNAARIKDSALEKAAAQRAATPGLNLEEEDDHRWGISAAQERKRHRDDQDDVAQRSQ
ncbi:MAG TPA: hypothetical protein VK989_16185 [Polyangia bacterium]|jgi:hypothetical protein|nr:hypothetical protein [Polyangia bacterium]